MTPHSCGSKELNTLSRICFSVCVCGLRTEDKMNPRSKVQFLGAFYIPNIYNQFRQIFFEQDVAG